MNTTPRRILFIVIPGILAIGGLLIYGFTQGVWS